MSGARRPTAPGQETHRETMTKRYVGIDLGGTNLKVGLVSAEGKVLRRVSIPTQASRGPAHVLARMAAGVRRVAREARLRLEDVSAVGVGTPGPVDTRRGVVVFAPNLPGWRNIAVRRTLQEALGRTVVLENDANVAAYGEFRCGVAGAVRDLVMLTLGTGVGGGIVLDGRLFRGVADTGAELGHIVIVQAGRRCGCGNRGCLEAYASATAVVARLQEHVDAGAPTCLAPADGRRRRRRAPPLTCEAIFHAAAQGDALATRIVEETAEYLATGITSLLHVLNPQRVVLTGGMMGAGDAFLNRVRGRVTATAFPRAAAACEVCWSTLGGDAGILGAALAAEAFDRTGQPA